MLTLLSRKLCPLMTLALAFGCGKKINDPSTSDVSRTGQTQTSELPSILNLRLDESVSNYRVYQMPRNAWFNLPETLKVRTGNPTGKRVKIYYNLMGNGEYEFLCNYKSTDSLSQMNLENCVSNDSIEIISNPEDLGKMDFPMDKGTSIQMQLSTTSGTGLVIESTYQVEWK